MKKKTADTLKSVLNMIIIVLLGAVCLVFALLYIDTFVSGFVFQYSTAIKATTIIFITLVTVGAIVFLRLNVDIVFKFCYITVILISLFLVLLYVLKVTGVMNKIHNVDELREYIKSMGAFAWLTFIILQFLQVVVLPIPAFISVGVGVVLFGPFKAALFSFIGILIGSLVAFFIGRVLGYRVAAWLVGKDNLEKTLKAVKGKDKAVLTFMFLFPFFPDDVLCFVAGLSSMSKTFFIIMITITRFISIFVSCYAYNNSIIPYDTWWGILLWIAFFAFTVFLTVFIYKKGDKVEDFFRRKILKKHKKVTNKK